MSELEERAEEIANFLDIPYEVALKRLDHGFLHNHVLVAEDFLATNPQTDDELLAWYLSTEAYIWELSAYHLDPGFNYAGMTAGITEKIVATFTDSCPSSPNGKCDDPEHNRSPRVLVLGDGIGDLSLALQQAGLNAVYHDLQGSRTAEYAQFRHERHMGEDRPKRLWTRGWEPEFGIEEWDTILSLDFMEHLPEPQVRKWSQSVYRALRPGGLWGAQNAFAIGDSEHGNSIPTHVSASNHYEQDWLPLMTSLGFTQVGDIWYLKS